MSTQDRKSISVAVENLCFSAVHRKTKEEFNVLDNVNFVAQPGQLLAIMGPSGCGKSTLLNMMAGRILRGPHTRGHIYYSGISNCNPTSFSRYVMQNDHLVEYLSVLETLETAAKLKMRGYSKRERDERIESVMKELGLWDCRFTLVGGHSQKGISGGERKRVSIALELLEDPKLLFLDEPTSGLDASRAYDTLEKLVHLARAGRTIICTVHSPRSPIFALFGQILLLSKGQVVYHGPANAAVPYFASQGFPCPQWCSPPDFILDLLTSADETKDDEDSHPGFVSQILTSMRKTTELLKTPRGGISRAQTEKGIDSKPSATFNYSNTSINVTSSPTRPSKRLLTLRNSPSRLADYSGAAKQSSPHYNSPSRFLELGGNEIATCSIDASSSPMMPMDSVINSRINDEALSLVNKGDDSTLRHALENVLNSKVAPFTDPRCVAILPDESVRATDDGTEFPQTQQGSHIYSNQAVLSPVVGVHFQAHQDVDTAQYLVRYTMPGLKPTTLEILAAEVTAKEEQGHLDNIKDESDDYHSNSHDCDMKSILTNGEKSIRRHPGFSLGNGHRISLLLDVIQTLPDVWTLSNHFSELSDRMIYFTDFQKCQNILLTRDELVAEPPYSLDNSIHNSLSITTAPVTVIPNAESNSQSDHLNCPPNQTTSFFNSEISIPTPVPSSPNKGDMLNSHVHPHSNHTRVSNVNSMAPIEDSSGLFPIAVPQKGHKKIAAIKRFLHIHHKNEVLPECLADLRKRFRNSKLERWSKVTRMVPSNSLQKTHGSLNSSGASNLSIIDHSSLVSQMYDLPLMVRGHFCFLTALPPTLYLAYVKYKCLKLLYDASTWLTELFVLTRRLLLGSIRCPRALVIICIQKIVSSLLLGWFYWHLGYADAKAANNRVGLLFWLCLNTTIALHSVLPAFPKRRALVNKEIANGMYSRSAYYIAENIAVLPWELIGNTFFFVIVGYMAGLNNQGSHMGTFVGISNLLVFAIIGIMTACSAVSSTVELANIVASLSILLCILSAGFYVHSDNIPHAMRWFNNISFIRHAFVAFLYNDLRGVHFDSNTGSATGASLDTVYQIANMSANQNIKMNCESFIPGSIDFINCSDVYYAQRDAFIQQAQMDANDGFYGDAVISQLGFANGMGLSGSACMLFVMGILYRVMGYIGFKYFHRQVGLEL